MLNSITSPLDGIRSPFGPQRGFNPSRLFSNNEPGVWFEANDASTLFTDVAGTTPVTTPGDAVALQLDKSGRGNHRTQATTAARPLYALHPVGGVRNKLEYTEEFDNAVWDKASGVTATANATTAPDGSETADLVSPGRINQTGAITGVANQTVTASIWVKGSTGVTTVVFRIDRVGSAQGNEETYAISDSAWTRITKTATLDGGTAAPVIRVDVQGTGSFLWGAQLEQGSTATNYQRVGSFLDVSEEGKARRGRLWYNGTSHTMQTGTITPGTDKVQVFAGVRKLSVANTMVIAEISANADTNNGVFVLANVAFSGNSFFRSKGTIQADTNAVSSVAPITRLVSGLGDISGNRTTLRVDGVQVAQSVSDQGTGNYLAYPIYFGARAGTSLFFNGYEDTSIIRFGPNLDDTTISKVESYVASKTPEETI